MEWNKAEKTFGISHEKTVSRGGGQRKQVKNPLSPLQINKRRCQSRKVSRLLRK